MSTDKKTKKQLWKSLQTYHFSHLVPPHMIDYVAQVFGGTDACTMAFASKLSRKLEWKKGFALRAIGEYKKFVFLGVTSRTPVTPSKVIDQVWHEHQLFTKAYRDFCGEIICQDFDHNPELIPLEEQTLIFSDQYLDTIDLYQAEFNMLPPADIWSVPKFNSSLVAARSARKSAVTHTDIGVGDDAPIYLQTDSVASESHHSASFEGFGGGDSGGGGATSSWDSGGSSSGHSNSCDSSSSSSDSGCSDSGASSCSSGSSCGSSCGGGGGCSSS